MAKKKVSKKSASVKQYKSFHLHGSYQNQKLFFLMFLDLAIGFVLGFMLQPIIVSTLTSYAAAGY